MTICSYLYAIVYSDFWTVSDLKSWLFTIIDESDNCTIPYWVLDVSTAVHKNDILDILLMYSRNEKYKDNNDFSIQNVVIGYYYLMYCKNKIEVDTLIKNIRDASDDFFDRINSYYDVYHKKILNLEKLNETLNLFCSRYMTEAERQFKLICSYRF